MATLLAVLVGGLYAAGAYLMLRRSLFKLILGLVLISHGANLLIFTAGGLTRGRAPILPKAESVAGKTAVDDHHRVVGAVADPLPQALILTAIVIGFGVLAFALVLFHRTYQTTGSDDPDELKGASE